MSEFEHDDLMRRIDHTIQQRKRLLRYIMLGVSTFLYVLFMALMWGIFLTDQPIRGKAKRDDPADEEPYVTISDDGELIPLERDPDSDADEPRQQRR